MTRLRRCVLAPAVVFGLGCAKAPAGDTSLAASAPAASPPRVRQDERPAPVALPAGKERESWAVQSRYVYDMKLGTAISVGGSANAFDFDLTGHLEVTPTSATNDTVSLYMTAADAAISSRVPGSQPELDKVAAAMRATGCFVTMEGGRLTELRVPPSASSMVVNAYREVASAMQLALPPSTGETEYSAEEFDTTGSYVAAYRFVREDGLWHKRKEKYLRLLHGGSAPVNFPANLVPEVVSSDATFDLSSGWPKVVSEREELLLQGAQAAVRSVTAVRLESGGPLPAKQPSPNWPSLASSMTRLDAADSYGAPPSVDSLDEARIHGLVFADVVSRLERLADRRGQYKPTGAAGSAASAADPRAPADAPAGDESRLFIAVTAFLRKQPATIADATRRIRAGSPASMVLIDALGSGSSPAALDALLDISRAKTLDAKVRSRATAALERAPRPTGKAIAAIRAVLNEDEFSPHALYTVGTYSRRLRDEGDLKNAKELGDFLLARLAAAPTLSSLATVLRAIANSGYAPALPQVVPFLTDDREQVRGAAVHALQSMKDPRVDEILAERLTAETSSDVSIAAVEAAAVREPSDDLARALRTAATSAPDPHVRYRVVELMVQWLPRRPELRSALEEVARVDSQPELRARAQAAL